MAASEIIAIAGIVFGGGSLGVIVAAFLNRKVGMKGNENEARRDVDTAWDSIVNNMLATQAETDKKLATLQGEVDQLKQDGQTKDRLLIVMFQHILKLEGIIEAVRPPIEKPARPAEMDKW